MRTKTWLRTSLSLVTVWMAVGRISAQAQPAWFNPSTPGTRCCVGMVFDPAVNSTLLFGGYGGPNNPDLGDTWVLGEGGWLQMSAANSPPPRSGAGMAYDATTKTVVLFGGNARNDAGDLNDTWIWNGTNWTQVFPPVSPPARRWDTQGMAYHAPSGKVVLFGGVTSGGAMFGDAWIWDGTTQTWTQLSPSPSPAPRRAPLAYDPATETIVLFGGEGGYGGPLYGDTWIWTGTNWRQRSPATSPPPRSMASMAYDAQLRRLVLFGGSGAGSNFPFYNDSWTWDGITWTQLSPGSGPPERYAFGMSYDPREQAVVLYGGLDLYDTVVLGDTWILATAP
jgi:Galactose oxidase, central domain